MWLYKMAKIEKEQVCHLVVRELNIMWQHLILIFNSIIYIVQLYKADCIILWDMLGCWAIALPRTKKYMEVLRLRFSTAQYEVSTGI